MGVGCVHTCMAMVPGLAKGLCSQAVCAFHWSPHGWGVRNQATAGWAAEDEHCISAVDYILARVGSWQRCVLPLIVDA